MHLSNTNRILLNIIATYGRSLFAMLCGIFSGRWVLMALGDVDYGLFAVVGSMMVFVSFFNALLGRAIGRFYAYSVGKETSCHSGSSENTICQWFNTALLLHSTLPVILLSAGYPIGTYAVKYFLTIPAEKVESCLWVWRFVCISGFVGMVSVPYSAMYTAKQYIAELSLYSIAGTLANIIFVYYMASHPREWLTTYAFGMCVLSITPQILICLRACYVFPECRIVFKYLWNWMYLKKLFIFVGWQFFGDFGSLMRNQGIAVLINKMFGPVMNTTMGIGNVVASHSGQLTSALNGAFYPAITTLAGQNEQKKMLRMAQISNKYGMLLTLIFVLPLVLELPLILRLWLKNPPPLATETCMTMLLIAVIDSANQGSGGAVTANGKIALYYFVLGMMNILMVPVAWLTAYVSRACFYAVLGTMVTIRLAAVVISIYLAQKVIAFSFYEWIRFTVMPVLAVSLLVLCSGLLLHLFMSESLLRLFSVTIFSEIVFAVTAWHIALSSEEQKMTKDFLFKIIAKLSNLPGKC